MKNELNFLSERDKYNLIIVYPFLYLNASEKEVYNLFRNGEPAMMGMWRWEWDNGELLDTNIAEDWDTPGQFNPGHRQFSIKCYSIEDVCSLYIYFLKEGFKCKVGEGDGGIELRNHSWIGNKSIERTYMTRDDIIKESQLYSTGMEDSFDNCINQRWINVQVFEKDFGKFKSLIEKLENSGYSNVWIDNGCIGLEHLNHKGTRFIIK